MRAAKEQRLRQNMQATYGQFVNNADVLTVMTMQPEVRVAEATQLNFGLAIGGAVGLGMHARRGTRERDASIRETRGATTGAGRFPSVATNLILAPAGLAAADIHYVTGRSSMVLASYRLSEIAFLTQLKRKGSAVIEFTDGSEVGLRAISGTAKHAQKFLDCFELHLAGEPFTTF